MGIAFRQASDRKGKMMKKDNRVTKPLVNAVRGWDAPITSTSYTFLRFESIEELKKKSIQSKLDVTFITSKHSVVESGLPLQETRNVK